MLKTSVLQHFQAHGCQTYWFYNVLNNNVADTIGFPRGSTKQLLEYLAANIFKIDATAANGFNNICFGHVAKPLVLLCFPKSCC